MLTEVKTKKLRPIVRCFGGKYYLHQWIISHFPLGYENLCYIEPFIGGGSCLLNKWRSSVEIINDLDPKLISIWQEVKNNCDKFHEQLSLLNYNQETFDLAIQNKLAEPINEYVLRRMSRSGMRTAFSWSERLRGGVPGDYNSWLTALAELPLISKRLRNVQIYNMDAIQLLMGYANYTNTLSYVDCPYLHETRVSTKAYGDFEMTENDHRQLAEVLNAMQGKVIVSGYASALYDEIYKGWRVERRLIVNHSSQNKKKAVKEEFLWLNW